jgi:predicted DNA-binding transcriptional regulator AlpA
MEVPAVDTAWGPKDVARFLNISIRHLAVVRVTDDTFPEPQMLGSLPRWAAPVVMGWLAREDAKPKRSRAGRPARPKAGQRVH